MAVGGAVGTALRVLVVSVVPGAGRLPLATLALNVAGAFALGVMVELVAPHREQLRAVLGTGLLGAFTTFSALTVEAVVLTGDGAPVVATGYVVASVAAGLGAAVAGRHLGRRVRWSP